MTYPNDSGPFNGPNDFSNSSDFGSSDFGSPDLERFDERAFAAGRALQQPPPDGSLARVRSSYRRRRAAPVAAMGVAALVTVGGLFALTRSRSVSHPAGPGLDTLPSDTRFTITDGTVTDPEGGTVPAPTGPPSTIDTTTTTTTTTATPTTTTTPTAATAPPPGDLTGRGQPTPPTTTGPQLLFWRDMYVGRWQGSTFQIHEYSDPLPLDLVGTQLQLVNRAGETLTVTAAECYSDSFFIRPDPERSETDNFWFTTGAPFSADVTNDPSSLAAMNAALVAQGLDPAKAESYGAPIAADGSVDRLVWYRGDGELINWTATFDVETATLRTVDGDPADLNVVSDVSEPEPLWVDLDGDHNLESMIFGGDTFALVEWATQEGLWADSPVKHFC